MIILSFPLSCFQLPWKSLASIVQFYYMWKTTDRYIQQVGFRSENGPPNPLCLEGTHVLLTEMF